MAVCHYHPDRTGVGICMRCRVVVCADCCTRLGGVNHCHACLKAMGGWQDGPAGGRLPAAAGALAVLGLGWLLFVAVGWLAQGWLGP
jgi:hypothetical protein